MKKLAVTLGSVSLAALMGIGFGLPAAHAENKVDCAKVMNALKGPDVTPRHVAGIMKISIESVRKCQDAAARAMNIGGGPIPDSPAHPVVGPGGASTDPSDYATKMKQRAW